jgi:hypothetical protein
MADASCRGGEAGSRRGSEVVTPMSQKRDMGHPGLRWFGGPGTFPYVGLHGGRMVDIYRGNCEGLFGIDEVAEFLRGFEERDFFGGDFYFGSGFWVASDARVSLARTEASKSSDFDLVAGFQGSDD